MPHCSIGTDATGFICVDEKRCDNLVLFNSVILRQV